jgi:HAD superfamily hydrolase (TIGR01509 family)
MKHPLIAVIFDHDGTLVDSEPVHHRCWQQALEPFKTSFPLQDYVTHLAGIPSLNSAQWMIERFDLPTDPATLYGTKQAYIDAFLTTDAFPLMPHAEELVRFCHERNLRLAVASGSGHKEIHRSLSAHGLNRWISIVASKNDVTHNKPAPDVYHLALQRLGVSAEQTVAIEDSTAGETAALAADLWCLRLHSTRPHLQVVPIHTLKDAMDWVITKLAG